MVSTPNSELWGVEICTQQSAGNYTRINIKQLKGNRLTMHDDISKILLNFDFTDEDSQYLISIHRTMAEYAQKIADDFYEQLLGDDEAKQLLSNKAAIASGKGALVSWYKDLFSGKYDQKYLQKTQRIAASHVKTGIDSNLVNACMHNVCIFSLDLVEKHYGESLEKKDITSSLLKILDINLAIMSKARQEAELKKAFLSHRLESLLVCVAERFTYGLNLVLVAALIGISVGTVWVFLKDVIHIVKGGDMGHGLVSAMGSLIIIWVMIELMETEIEHLKGKAFPVLIFIHVALVSFIREVLVVSLQHNIKTQMLMAGTSFVLGLIYWMVAKAEQRDLKH